ncbi:MAG: type II secretion system protein GspD [Planctomycetota bacterium]
MSVRSRKITRRQKTVSGLALIIMPLIGGCGEFFAQKPTEIESQRIRDRIKAIQPVAEPNITKPAVYQMPPKIVKQTVGGTEEWKLFYFCRHHTAVELAGIVTEQFGSKLFDKEGKETVLPDYKVSSNAATNQLIVRCPAIEDIEAVLETLQMIDVPPVQVKIECIISEVYADKTLDWETTVEIGDLLGEDISAGGSAELWGSDVIDLLQESTPLPAFPGASLRDVARSKMGLKVGYFSEDHDFLALVDMLESKGYLKILMSPTLEVVNGQRARIESLEKVPLDKMYLYDREGFVESRTEYVDVIDALEVTPHVFADNYIGLETTALIGSKNIPEGVKQIRIVTKREIYNKENRIRQGESLVIGGIRKSEEHSVIRGVPLLKDVPVLGVLFSSKDYEERAVETVFILTPTISTGGIPNKEMVEEVRRKHEQPDYPKELQDAIMDPLGFEAREREHELKLQELEEQRQQAATEKDKARQELRQAKAEVQQANTAVEKARQETAKARVLAEAERRRAEEALMQAEKAEAKAKRLKEEAEKGKAEAEELKAEAEKAKGQAAKQEG